MPSRTKRPLIMGGAALVGAVALTLGGALAASAHVGLSGSSDEAGASSLLTFSFSHGCDGSPTTGLTIQIPEGINSVTPQIDALWDVEKVTEQLQTPIQDAHGNEITERVAQVVYTAKTPFADGYRGEATLSLTLPEDAAGSSLAFPTIQSCEVGENAWVQIAEEGQTHDDLDSPAPTFAVVATSTEADAGHDDSSSAAEDEEAAAAPAAADQTPLVVTSLIVGALGLILAVVALMIRERKKA
ncbi:MAG: hypothetical protein BGO95_10645 [Micrococcales bacterium 73-13]|nr:MAG: hypothetical protein BGO95_10645 [Micrococcales bacterium 73-13]